jgi:hypothetical protein
MEGQKAAHAAGCRRSGMKEGFAGQVDDGEGIEGDRSVIGWLVGASDH